jgi:hypothetical protein
VLRFFGVCALVVLRTKVAQTPKPARSFLNAVNLRSGSGVFAPVVLRTKVAQTPKPTRQFFKCGKPVLPFFGVFALVECFVNFFR